MKKLIRGCVFDVDVYEPGKNKVSLQRKCDIEGEICKLASNENPLGPSLLAIKEIQKSLEDGHLYPDTNCSALVDKLATSLGFSIDNLAVGNGSTDLIHLIGVAFLNPGETFIMSQPSFIMAKMVAQVMDCSLIEIPLKNYVHDLTSISKAIEPKTKLIYLDNPINPIGTSVKERDISRFMADIPEDVLVVLDEAYFEYVRRDDYPDSLRLVEENRNVIVLRTFSKLYGLAGLRIGYCVAKEDFIDAIRRVTPPFTVNRLAQLAAAAAYDDQEHIEKSRTINETGKKYLYDKFEKMSVFYIPSDTNFITIDVKSDAERFSEKLMEGGVIVRPLTMYGLPTFLRVTIGTEKQNEKFLELFRQQYKT